VGKQQLRGENRKRNWVGKNEGSGQLIDLPVQRALAVDGNRIFV
jgi:hypothetical protein